ncbi:MAG: helix-turn-helix domain-containing protein [Actinomycetota bacterium]|nr:helix-turn-helix domain-containing protein [Actinomycetota bacterium]
MSLKAMNWVWDHSTAAGTELLVLLAIADNADDTGANAYPSTDTLARKTRLDTRTVQRVIRRLAERGHLMVHRGGGRAANRYSIPLTTPQQPVDNPPDPVDNPADSVDESPTPPAERHRWQIATGGTGATPGVAQLRHRRGGTATPPEPSYNRPRTTTPARSSTAATGDTPTTAGGGGKPLEDVFDALGPAWPLSPAQRTRLAPGVAHALTAGWSPDGLAELLGANPHGVRSAVAVLESRLADLPPPLDAPEPTRPAWCGSCDQHTRHRETDTGTPYRCPTCHPSAAS